MIGKTIPHYHIEEQLGGRRDEKEEHMRHRKTNGLNQVFLPVISLVIGLLCITVRVSGQSGAKDGEWPRPTARTWRAPDTGRWTKSTQPTFNELEVAWRFKTDNLGPFPEYKLEGTPLMVNGVIYTTGGTRRSVGRARRQDR